MSRIIPTTFFLFIALFAGVNLIQGQGIAIGEWRTHLPYDEVIDVAVTGDVVFAATPNSLFTYNTIDTRVDRFDKAKELLPLDEVYANS